MADNTEIFFTADTAQDPIAYSLNFGTEPADRLEVEILGPGLTALRARHRRRTPLTAELLSAVSIAYRETTGDPTALSDDEVNAVIALISHGTAKRAAEMLAGRDDEDR